MTKFGQEQCLNKAVQTQVIPIIVLKIKPFQLLVVSNSLKQDFLMMPANGGTAAERLQWAALSRHRATQGRHGGFWRADKVNCQALCWNGRFVIRNGIYDTYQLQISTAQVWHSQVQLIRALVLTKPLCQVFTKSRVSRQ